MAETHPGLDLGDIETLYRNHWRIERIPGYAYLSKPDQPPLLGETAMEQLCLHPGHSLSGFWADLSQQPIASTQSLSHTLVRHSADLAWHSLKAICARHTHTMHTSWVLSLPASYQPEQLKLLAGICQALDMPIQAMVNRALATAMAARSLSPLGSSPIVIELQQTQARTAYFSHKDHQLSLERVESHPGLGFSRLSDHWMHLLRERFIQESRLDPMHSGDTEQQLFNQLYRQLVMQKTSQVSEAKPKYHFEIQHRGHTYRQTFNEQDFATAVSHLFQEIGRFPENADVILDPVFQPFPGCPDASIRPSPKQLLEAANEIAQQGIDRDAQAHIPYFSACLLPENTEASKTATATKHPEFSSKNPATHLCLDGYLYPANRWIIQPHDHHYCLKAVATSEAAHIEVHRTQLVIGQRTEGLEVNGQKAETGQLLHRGDQLLWRPRAESSGDTAAQPAQLTAAAFLNH